MKKISLILALSISFSITQPLLANEPDTSLEREQCSQRFASLFAEADSKKLPILRDTVSRMLELGMVLPTQAKAILMNHNKGIGGFLVEVGAAPRTARYFDDSPERSNTIIDSFTHNGKKRSNKYYGISKTGFVSKERINAILNVEAAELTKEYIEEPDPDFPAKDTRFFVFGNTSGTNPDGDGHSWVGIRFQMKPLGPWHTVTMHVRLRDPEVPNQTKMLGVLGVNLVHAVFHKTSSIQEFMVGLKENIPLTENGGLEIDGMHFDGPEFKDWTDDYVAAWLLRTDLTETIYISGDGEFLAPSQKFYKRAILLHELNPDLRNVLGEDTWATGIQKFSALSNTPTEKIDAVNWVCMAGLRGADGRLTEEGLKIIQRFRNARQPLIISKFTHSDNLSKFNKVFKVGAIGILENTYDQKFNHPDEKTEESDGAHTIRYLVP